MLAGSGKAFIWHAAAINNDGVAIVACMNSSSHAMAGEQHGLRISACSLAQCGQPDPAASCGYAHGVTRRFLRYASYCKADNQRGCRATCMLVVSAQTEQSTAMARWLIEPRGQEGKMGRNFSVKKMPGYMENRWLAKTTTGVKTQ